jgi:DNA-binding transcriptional regulator YhcF (GntR family)
MEQGHLLPLFLGLIGPAGGKPDCRVYARLRDEIVRGRLVPGQKLGLPEISKREGVSFNVVREALSRLAGQRLVHSAPQQGFSVATIAADELRDLLEVRIDIEQAGLARAVNRMDLECQVDLVASFHRLSQTSSLDPERSGIRRTGSTLICGFTARSSPEREIHVSWSWPYHFRKSSHCAAVGDFRCSERTFWVQQVTGRSWMRPSLVMLNGRATFSVSTIGRPQRRSWRVLPLARRRRSER